MVLSRELIRRGTALLVAGLVLAPCNRVIEIGSATLDAASDVAVLEPTDHPPVPETAAEAWLVPGPEVTPTAAEKAFATVAARIGAGEFTLRADALNDKRLETSPVAGWAAYYAGLVHLKNSHPADAVRVLDPLVSSAPDSAVFELAARTLADAAEATGDLPRSLQTLTSLAERKTAAPDEVLKRLAEVASRAGEGGRARAAWLRLYYEYPLSLYANDAETVAAEARAAAGDAAEQVFQRDLARAEALFAARRYTDARGAFERLAPAASGEAKEIVELRLAECDYYAGRHNPAIARLAPWLDGASRRAEARFFYLSSLRALGRHDEYVTRARALFSDFPDSSWAEEALNNLATHYVLVNDDASAAAVFRQVVSSFPNSRHAERAAWRYGWWLYKLGELREAAGVFEAAAVRAPRSDHRPAWIYWAGRAREAMGDATTARERYRVVVADYMHSYYGRLASRRLEKRKAGVRAARTDDAPASEAQESQAAPASPKYANADTIQRLLALGLWEEALSELRFAQRRWGTSPRLEATLAWVYHKQGDLRRGITAMKRAYPQYLADGGERLPRQIAEVIFPMAYWSSIRRHAAARGLDPHLVAALIAQESTFQPDARSAANAWGLMQILPSTGRRLARTEGIRRFTTQKLTDPEINIRLGTRYFASLVKRFDGAHYALASYNAGESRVVRWRAERPGLPEEEFIDDIPFPETQNYVKKILGTAADYRALYPLKARPAEAN